jgi:hypothetical protein
MAQRALSASAVAHVLAIEQNRFTETAALHRMPQQQKSQPRGEPISSTAENGLPKIAAITAVVIAVVVGAVLRFWASFDAFWLDEIWSWIMVAQLTSPAQVFTRVHVDNNHHLNSLIIYLLGQNAPLYAYRLPAVLAGIGTVVLCGFVARRWNRPAAVAAILITAFSFLLVEYSSEARGYAYLLFFMMASFAVLQESFDRPRAHWDVLFACCAILGFLSHLTYLFAYASFIAWSAWRHIAADGWLSRRHVRPFIFQVVVPCAFMLFLYFVDLRHVVMGGGDRNSMLFVVAQAISVALGGPMEGTLPIFVALAVVVVAIVALVLIYRTGSDLWVLMAVGIFLAPLAILLVARPQWPYPRYFLVCMLLLQLLISWLLGWVYQRPYGKVAYLLILAAILAGNAILTTKFLKYGRGGYAAAVGYMIEHTASDRILVGSDHDFRNKAVLGFYFARAGDQERSGYYDYGHWPPEGPEWVVLHNASQSYVPAESLKDEAGNTYGFVRVFRYAGLSGFNWALYHNTNRPMKTPLDAGPPSP